VFVLEKKPVIVVMECLVIWQFCYAFIQSQCIEAGINMFGVKNCHFILTEHCLLQNLMSDNVAYWVMVSCEIAELCMTDATFHWVSLSENFKRHK